LLNQFPNGFKLMKSVALVLGLLFVFNFSSTPLRAQAAGTTDIDISFPPLVILFYYDNIDITISRAALAGIVAGGTGDTALSQGTVSGNAFTPNLSISSSTTGFTSPAAVDLDLIEAWAVRAIGDSSGAGTVQVTLSVGDDTLTETGGDTITINSLNTRLTSVGGAFSPSVTFPAQGLGTAILGDLRLNLDLSGATVSGDYVDGQFTVTATGL